MAEEIAGMVVKLAMESGSFNEQIQAINREMKVVDSEFKATGNTAKSFGESMDGLEANLKRCNDMIILQQKAVDLYADKMINAQKALDRNVEAHQVLEKQIADTTNALNDAKSKYGDSSQEVAEYEKQLLKLRDALDKNEQLIRNSQKTLDGTTVTYNNATAKMKQYERQVEDTKQAIDQYGKELKDVDSVNVSSTKSVSELTIAMGNLVAEGIEMAVDAFKELVQASFEYTEQMTKFASQTNMSVESLQQWDAILGMTGGNIDQLAGSLADFTERISDAAEGQGEAFEIFNKLGVSVTDASGALRNTEDVFNDTISALQNMSNETEKSAYSTMLLSTGGEELASVLDMTNDELKEIKGNINVLSGDEVAQIQEFSMAWKAMKQELNVEFMKVLATYSGDYAEQIEKISDALLGVLKMLEAFAPLLKGLKTITDNTINLIPNLLLKGLGELGNVFDKSAAQTKESTTNIKSDVESTAETAKDAFSQVGETVKDSMKSAEDEIKDTLGAINDGLEEYYDKNRRDYKKYLDQKYGDSKAAEVKKSIEMQKYDDSVSIKIEKDMQMFSKLYGANVEGADKSEKKMTDITIRESNKRIEQYKKEAMAINNRYGATSPREYPSYDTGTQYHMGGLAYVHQDELIELPRGAKVNTKGQTQQILNQTNNQTSSNPIIIQSLNVKSDNANDLIEQLKNLSRRG